MALIRERGNVIDYNVPITGNMKDPKFHLDDVFFDLLGNIFVKPATTHYGAQVRNVENLIERSLTWTWPMRNSAILPDQERFIQKIADHLASNPHQTITVYPNVFSRKEKEYILLFEARKKFYLKTRGDDVAFTGDDSANVDKLSMRSALFSAYLNKKVPDRLAFTIQGKCVQLIDSGLVNSMFAELNARRKSTFLAYFEKRHVEKQVRFSSDVYVTPFNGFSFYEIRYEGKVPDHVEESYLQMNELNQRRLRRKFRAAKLSASSR
jgi:hypothetical protein